MLLKINSLSLIKISGADAKQFMQGQFTANLENITAEHAGLSAYCNAKGRIIALFTVICTKDCYFLLMPRDIAATFIKKLNRFAMFSKVKLQDVTDDIPLYGAYQDYINDNHLEKKSNYTVDCAGDLVYLWQPSLAARLLIIDLEQQITDFDDTEQNNDWLLSDIEVGIPNITQDLSESYLGHPLNLVELQAISFDKGCYVGQEILARTQYRGTVKKHIQRGIIETAEAIAPQDKLYIEDKVVGEVVNFRKLSAEKYEVLALLKDQIHGENNISLANSSSTFFHLLELPYTVKISV